MLKSFGVVVISLSGLIAGCGGMADAMSGMAGIGVVSEEKATFDGANIVTMSPAFLYREGAWFGVPIKLGAQWSDKSPEQVALILAYGSDIASSGSSAYLNFSGLDINIDGKITSHAVGGMTSHDSSTYNTVSRTIYTESRNAVVVPLAMLQDMLQAKDCRLRIRTSKGYEDVQFSIERIPGGQGTAILSMREFMSRVQSKSARAGK